MKYDAELQDKFEKYAQLLRDWQPRVNLVAPSTLGDIQHRHIDDSTQLAGYLPKNITIIDLGSGAGFPAVVLAIMGWNVIAIESIGKKTKFLEELKTQLNLPNLTVVNDRVENYLRNPQSSAPPSWGGSDRAIARRKRAEGGLSNIIFTARAFATLEKILDYIWLCPEKSKGAVVAPVYLLKGANVGKEIAAAQRKYKFDYQLFPSKTGDGFIVSIKNISKK